MRVQAVNRRPIGPGDQVSVDIHRDLHTGVAELLLDIGKRLPLLDEETRIRVPEVVQADLAEPRLLQQPVEHPAAQGSSAISSICALVTRIPVGY